MKVTGLLHVALLSSDLEASKQFYEGVLRLKQKPRPSLAFPGVWYELGDVELHLIVTAEQLLSANERPNRDFHLALAVEDYESIKKQLEDTGVPFKERSAGVAQIFVRDPDGNLIELQSV